MAARKKRNVAQRTMAVFLPICLVAQWIRGGLTEPGIAGASPAGVMSSAGTLEDRPRREEGERPCSEAVGQTEEVKETTPNMVLLQKLS